MTAPDDGRFTFRVGNVWPRLGDWDGSWTLDAIDVLRIIENSCYWMFWQLPYNNKCPALTGASVEYREGIRGEHLPLRINGWMTGRTDDDVTLVYLLRPESAAIEADPLFTAELRWGTRELGVGAPVPQAPTTPDEFRSFTGELPPI